MFSLHAFLLLITCSSHFVFLHLHYYLKRQSLRLRAEKELVLEIERLKRKNGPSTKKGKIPSKLDAFIRGIEEERDYYKQQTDMLQRMLRGEPAGTFTKPSSRSASPVREKGSSVDKKVRSPAVVHGKTRYKSKLSELLFP